MRETVFPLMLILFASCASQAPDYQELHALYAASQVPLNRALDCYLSACAFTPESGVDLKTATRMYPFPIESDEEIAAYGARYPRGKVQDEEEVARTVGTHRELLWDDHRRICRLFNVPSDTCLYVDTVSVYCRIMLGDPGMPDRAQVCFVIEFFPREIFAAEDDYEGWADVPDVLRGLAEEEEHGEVFRQPRCVYFVKNDEGQWTVSGEERAGQMVGIGTEDNGNNGDK